jgi:drug/metabolite transporter (DMT)-like permease
VIFGERLELLTWVALGLLLVGLTLTITRDGREKP